MLESTRLNNERIKLQSEINALPEVRSDDADAATKLGERNAKLTELNVLGERVIAATQKEDGEAQAAMARDANTDGWTPEMREFHALGQRTSMAEYMRAGIALRQLTPGTPEHEYNKHVFGDTFNVGDYPVEMLLDRSEYFNLDAHQAQQVMEPDDEQRTVITGNTGAGGNLTFVDRLLQGSEGAYLRASYPAVGPGRHSYPIFSGTTSSMPESRAARAETPAGGLSVETPTLSASSTPTKSPVLTSCRCPASSPRLSQGPADVPGRWPRQSGS